MIPVQPRNGAIMAYRLDPYSLDLLPPKTSKPSIHDVIEPTVLFYHKKSPNGHYSKSPNTPKTPCEAPATPSRSPNQSKSPAVRYVSVTTSLDGVATPLIAPFRVAVGEHIVFQAANGGEHYGCVSHVASATTPYDSTISRRIVRKARDVDRKQFAVVSESNFRTASTIRSLLEAEQFHLNVIGVEWQFDRSSAAVSVACDGVATQELPAASVLLSKALGVEVVLFLAGSPQSSPALSCCSSVAGDSAMLEGSF